MVSIRFRRDADSNSSLTVIRQQVAAQIKKLDRFPQISSFFIICVRDSLAYSCVSYAKFVAYRVSDGWMPRVLCHAINLHMYFRISVTLWTNPRLSRTSRSCSIAIGGFLSDSACALTALRTAPASRQAYQQGQDGPQQCSQNIRPRCARSNEPETGQF
jgi:hypothetical protein